MRTLLRRLAWMVARLMLISALCFGMLSHALTRFDGFDSSHGSAVPTSADSGPWRMAREQGLGDFARDGVVSSSLPLFFNRSPLDLKGRVIAALDELTEGPSPAKSQELARLGAAALPEIMVRFAHLAPDAQARVADALLPVLVRMGVGVSPKESSAATAVAQLLSTWSELQADYSPSVRRRRVERAKERGQASHMAGATQLDTYALSELVGSLTVPNRPSDLPRLNRLTLLLSHTTGLDHVVSSQGTLPEARETVLRWKRWWTLHRSDYEVLDGPTRLASMLTETQFGQWLSLSIFHGFGTDSRGARISDTFQRPVLVTLILSLLGWLGHFAGATLTPFLLNHSGFRWKLLRRVLVAAGAVPVLVIVPWLAEPSLSHPRWIVAGLLCLAAGAGQAAFGESRRHAMIVAALADPWQAASIPPAGIRTGTSWLFLTSSDWPWLLTTLFVIEYASGLSGLGRWMITAFESSDLNTAMAASSITAFILLLLEVLVATFSHTRRDRPSPFPPRAAS
jgi:hypothetical protein